MALINVDFFSQSLGFNTQITVILPENVHDMKNGIINHTDGYPVLWLLHGAGEDHTAWQRHTSIERYAMDYSLAVVMPSAQLSFYSNMAYGGRYYDFLTEELPQIVRGFFPVSDKEKIILSQVPLWVAMEH